MKSTIVEVVHVKQDFCYRKQLELKIIPAAKKQSFAFNNNNNSLCKMIVLLLAKDGIRCGGG